jgi:hypothetical protein
MKWKPVIGIAVLAATTPLVLQSNDTEPSDGLSYTALPGDHNIRLGNAFHARGYETPYTAECTECHGDGLQGIGSNIPGCYGCHDNKWDEPIPVEIGPIIYFAEYQRDDKKSGKLKYVGENATEASGVIILNAVSDESLGITEADKDGEFASELKYQIGALPPCVVFAKYTDDSGNTFSGPSIIVLDKQTGQPVQRCEGALEEIDDISSDYDLYGIATEADADVYLSRLQTPNSVNIDVGRPTSRKAWASGDGTEISQDATVSLVAIPSSNLDVVVTNPDTSFVVPSKPETRFEFTVIFACTTAGQATVEWTAIIDAAQNADPSNDSLVGTTPVNCR